MSDEKEAPSKVKTIHLWFGLGVLVLSVMGNIAGPLYVYPEQQRQMKETVKSVGDSVAKLSDDLKNFKDSQGTLSNANSISVTVLQGKVTVLEAVAEDVRRHIADKNIHVTEDQMKNLIIAQLTPIAVSQESLKSTSAANKDSLNRMERDVRDLTNMLRPAFAKPPKENEQP